MIYAVAALLCAFFVGNYVSDFNNVSKNISEPVTTFKAKQSDYCIGRQGSWQDAKSQRAWMVISKKNNQILVTIHWSQSAVEGYYWKLPCVFSPNTGELIYKNGIHNHYVFEKNSEKAIENTIYSNGSGKLSLKNDRFLYWKDDIENVGARCKFEFVPDEGGTALNNDFWWFLSNDD